MRMTSGDVVYRASGSGSRSYSLSRSVCRSMNCTYVLGAPLPQTCPTATLASVRAMEVASRSRLRPSADELVDGLTLWTVNRVVAARL